MAHKLLAFLFAILCVFAHSSCQHKQKNIDGHENCIKSLRFVSSSTPNPDKIVFSIHTDENLKRLLLSGNWDSINYSGGIFDTINYSDRKVSPVQTENSNEFLFGLPAFKFFKYSQNQMDSIASITFEKVEINIFSKDETWRLKPCDKSDNIK